MIFKKQAKYRNKQFTRKNTCSISVLKCLASLEIKEIQIKTTIYHVWPCFCFFLPLWFSFFYYYYYYLFGFSFQNHWFSTQCLGNFYQCLSYQLGRHFSGSFPWLSTLIGALLCNAIPLSMSPSRALITLHLLSSFPTIPTKISSVRAMLQSKCLPSTVPGTYRCLINIPWMFEWCSIFKLGKAKENYPVWARFKLRHFYSLLLEA